MKKSDTEMQALAQMGKLEITDAETRAYVHVFSALDKEPPLKLPLHFANNVINHILAARARKSERRDFLWLGVGLFGFIIAAIITILVTGFRLDFGRLGFLDNYRWLVVFGGLLIAIMQWMDKKILQGNPGKTSF